MSDWPGAKWGFGRPPDTHASDELPLLGFAWVVPVLVLVAWWPSPSYWFSDDFIALHYASDFGRALADFSGNQYGLEGVVWFYRPLITASFAVEAALGASSFVTHLVNAVAHATSALLIVLIARRFLSLPSSALAGLVWGCMPGHAGAVFWA